ALTSVDICTANFVVKPEVGLEILPRALKITAGARGEDRVFYELVRQRMDLRVEKAAIKPIGVYDGLRTVATFRRRLKIPSLGLHRFAWLATLRKLLRG